VFGSQLTESNSWGYCGLRDSDDLSSKGQDIQNSERVQEHERQGQSNRSPTGTDNRLAIIRDTSNSTSTPALSSPSETEIPGSTTVSRELRVHYPSQRRGTERLHWWIHDAPHCNDHPIPAPTADLVITSDASKTGWGATCQGIHTGGPWGAQERAEHINLLELRAAFLALQMFASRHSGLHILLLIDNITAIAYINHKGGRQSQTLSDQAIELWEWCLVRKITMHAEHIPGQKNVEADAESRRALDQSDLMLNQKIFQALETKWGSFDVEAKHNKQLMRFFTFRPDLEAVDALAQPWMNIRPYAFAPFILLGRCLQKIRQEGVWEIVVIAPVWQGQPWFPPLIESLIDRPALLPQTHNFLTNPAGDPHPLVVRNQLYLAAWRLSGVQSRIREFQEKLSKSYAPHGEEVQRKLILQPGESGIAGVVRGRLIPFQDLEDP